MSRPFSPRNSSSSGPLVRVNGKIRAREVRVIGTDGNQLGILTLGDALTQARANGGDLVEIAPNATPPVCLLVDFGKFRYEQAKREKESRKHQHANKVKEVQLNPKINPHDLGVKRDHAIGFLCEDMKVKITLKFRGREMAHTEFGYEVVQKFLADLAAHGHPDYEPKLIGRGINVMITSLPRNKRAKTLRQTEGGEAAPLPPPRVENISRSIPMPIERPPGRSLRTPSPTVLPITRSRSSKSTASRDISCSAGNADRPERGHLVRAPGAVSGVLPFPACSDAAPMPLAL